jgi:hypothetical protein
VPGDVAGPQVAAKLVAQAAQSIAIVHTTRRNLCLHDAVRRMINRTQPRITPARV